MKLLFQTHRNQLFFIAAIVVILLLALLLTRPDLVLFREDRIWRAIQTRGTWRVGMDPSFPPFETLDAAGQPVGYDVDLARRIAAEWGLELEIIPIGFDSLLDAVQTDRIDSIVSAYPFDPRLTKDVAYSPPYFEAGIRLAVRADSPLAELHVERSDEFASHLAGKQIAVEWGGQGDGIGRRLQRADPTITLAPFETPQEAVAALRMDPTIDALLVDNVTLLQEQNSSPPIMAVGPALEGNPYVIVAPLHAHELQEAIAQTLEKLANEGVLEALTTTWLQKE